MGPGLWWDTEVSGPTAPFVFSLAGRSLVDSLWGAEQVQAGRVTLDKDLFGRRRGVREGTLGVIGKSVGPELSFAKRRPPECMRVLSGPGLPLICNCCD